MGIKYVPENVCIVRHKALTDEIEEIHEELINIRENHLKHLNEKIDKLSDKINDLEKNMAKWSGVAFAAFTIASLFINYIT